MSPSSRRSFGPWPSGLRSTRLLIVLLTATTWLAGGSRANALTPESPEVVTVVKRCVNYLSTTDIEYNPGRGGLHALVGLALIKGGAPHDHPRVKQSVEFFLRDLNSGTLEGGYGGYHRVYNASLGVIFLCALDPQKHRADINRLLPIIQQLQRPGGGFDTRPNSPLGETSMTQYATLAFWEASRAGFTIAPHIWENLTNFYIKSQDASGGFRYEPSKPQSWKPTHSLTAGALGGMYICANYVQPAGSPTPTVDPNAPKLPPALKPVGSDEPKRERRGPAGININGSALLTGMQRGDQWIQSHIDEEPEEWRLYYYYGIERYFAFRELWRNQPEAEPDWYTNGAKWIMRHESQGKLGATLGQSEGPIEARTAWGILFLVRSTRQTLKVQGDPAGSGSLVGGRGLPPTNADVQLRGGKVVVKPLSGPADQLLGIMEDPNDPKFAAAIEGFGEQVVAADESQLSPLLVRLRKLCASDNPEARAAAIRGLGRVRNLDNVPLLIYALQDSDPRVMLAAREGLQFISRKLEPMGPAAGAPPNERAKAVERWKDWYRSMRPDADFSEIEEALKQERQGA